ncbi:Endonuclease/Exonuclease/phosphatase family [Seminavis robusta]|uniref:Endonuclease/Exonuclease/phosphatase family n=1 Tax=Seminavis robusta TaxID=568900 RepID=A0A9N8DQL4_9STRA|nr:Endonuclease/Exonuclease/phosphatase family [Seminavis robusta]|eukprot:Sro301_g111930.1 Endonuclease/Exonuclease/phosphatase family (421) ;mRNA; r:37633-38895
MASAGRKRNPSSVIDLLDSDDDDDDSVVEVVAVTKKPRRDSSSNNNDDNQNSKKKKPAKLKDYNDDNNKQDTSSSAVKPASKASSKFDGPTKLSFNVATYNVWFGPPSQPQRMRALAQELFARNTSQHPLWFIGFQEVTLALWATLKPLLEAQGYRVFVQDLGGMDDAYGVALAVLQKEDPFGGKLRIISGGWQPYQNSIMQRGFLHCRCQMPHSNQQILFTTTHLESFLVGGLNGRPFDGAAQRKEQIIQLERFCINHQNRFPDLSVAIITGDLNWDDERVQATKNPGNDPKLLSVLQKSDWKDSWFAVRDKRRRAVADKNGKVKKKDEPQCYTYDCKESAMMGGYLRRRFDRILLRTQQQKGDATVNVRERGIELIGKEPIEGLQWRKENQFNGNIKVVPVLPSDHFGYVATYEATID